MMSRLEVYPDQTLPSLLGSAFGTGCVGSRRRAGRVLAGFEGAVISLDLPLHLARVAAVIGSRIGCDARDLVAHHTMLPVYAPWIEPGRLEQVITAMLGDGPLTPAALVATHASGSGLPTELRFCPQCRTEEINQHQCAWWHRAHQLWGRVCPIHHCPLVRSQFPRRNAWHADYPAVEEARELPIDREPRPLSFDFSADLAVLLNLPLRAYGRDALRTAYLELLTQAGFMSARLKRSDFLHAVVERYGSDYLKQEGLFFLPDNPYAWPAKIVVGAGGSHSPFRHLHVIRFLRIGIRDFLRIADEATHRPRPREGKGMPPEIGPTLRALWFDSSVSLAGICRQLRVHDHTVRAWASALNLELPRFADERGRRVFEERRSKMRQLWLQLCDDAQNPRRTTVLKWIARNDAAWFARNRRQCARASCLTLVDWTARDQALCRRIPGAIALIKGHFPFRRICRTSITDVLRVENQFVRGRDRLPLFSAEIVRVTEGGREFALRRIRMLRRHHPRAPRWRIRELASIPRPLPADPEIRSALGYPLNFSFKCKSR